MLTGLRSRIDRWVVLDVVVALVALATELPSYGDHGPMVVVGELAVAAAIAGRRVFPFPAALGFGVALTVQAIVDVDPPEDQLTLIAMVALAYTFGTLSSWRRSLAGLLLVVGGGCLHEVWSGDDYGFVVGITLVGWVPGVAVRYRMREISRLRDQADALQREQALREEAAVAAERNRLAQELHDVVSHSVSAMVVQAAAAEQVLNRDPMAATKALHRVQQTGRDAIAELHRLLGLLRPDEGTSPLAPAPDLAAVAALVDQARSGGQDVRLDLADDLPSLPTALQLSAYRVVQESLTNAGRYAPRALVHVRVGLHEDALEVEVIDTGGGPAVPSGGGRGLRGLSERAGVFGGTVEAGPYGEGFAVRARLPVPAAVGGPP